MDLILVTPSKEHEADAFRFIREFIAHSSAINGVGGLDRYEDYDEWLRKLDDDLKVPNSSEDRVPAHTYFCLRQSDGRIVGMINIRHRLNDFLLREGGHIGYSIRPTERRKGYGTQMLKLALEKCRELNLDRVLITCDKVNVASARVIINNNGVLENELYSELYSEIIERYWITL